MTFESCLSALRIHSEAEKIVMIAHETRLQLTIRPENEVTVLSSGTLVRNYLSNKEHDFSIVGVVGLTDSDLPVSEKSRTVHLLDMSGHEFEKLCRVIFSDLGYGTIEHTPLTGDMGKDLIIHSTQGKIFVECKHHPDSSIGRPDIQKLHSAVVSERAVKGIFVTSGNYSRQAMEHAKSLIPPIDLVDRHLLLDLASRAGIRLVTESGKDRIYTFRIADDRTLSGKISAKLESNLVSRPVRPDEIIALNKRLVSLRPVYWVEYDVDAEFSTSVGLIHVERASGRVFVDGNTGNIMVDEIGRYVSDVPTQATVPYDEIAVELKGVSNPQFKMQLSEIKEIATQHIVAKHTR